jgi:hypothetical protein
MVFEEVVGVGDVGLVVFAVMDFHRLRINVRHEGVESEEQGGERVGHDDGWFDFLSLWKNANGQQMHW